MRGNTAGSSCSRRHACCMDWANFGLSRYSASCGFAADRRTAMLPSTVARVPTHTAVNDNEEIHRHTRETLARYAVAGPEEIDHQHDPAVVDSALRPVRH